MTESFENKTIEGGLIEIARSLARGELKDSNITAEEIRVAVQLAMDMAEKNGDPYTLQEVSEPSVELRHHIAELLRARVRNREEARYARGYVFDSHGNVIGSVSSKREALEKTREERQADNQ